MTWLRFLMVALLATSSLLAAPTAQAATECSASVTALDFNSANPADGTTTATISYECTTYAFLTRVAVSMCFAIDAGSTPGSTITARRMANGDGDPLGFQMFKDPARTRIWGDSSASPSYLEIPPLEYLTFLYERQSGSIKIHGRLSDISQAAAGNYSNMLSNARLIYSYREGNNPNPPNCNQGNGGSIVSMPFEARVTVPPSCTAVTASDMNFSPGGLPLSGTSTGNLSSTSTIDLTCTKRTAWQVGLDDGQNPLGGIRRMCIPGGACLAYQLNQPDGFTPWGDDLDINTVDGISAGSPQSLTVNGRVNDQPLTQAGRYSDTVKVILTY